MSKRRYALALARDALPAGIACCAAIIGLNMYLIYATTGNVIAAHHAERVTYALQEELTGLAGETAPTSAQGPYHISHIVVVEPVAVSVAR